MARKITHYLLPNTSLTTMLQSADTARFHDDRMADKFVDVAQARAEILSALLFGYEVIIPAGAVADCPALFELLPEIMKDADPYLDRIRETTKLDYRSINNMNCYLSRAKENAKYIYWSI